MPDDAPTARAPTWERLRRGLAAMEPRLTRVRVIDATRLYFKDQGFHEVETPLFVRYPGMEPYLEVFSSTWQTSRGESHAGFLTTSPEYSMKKLLAAGVAPIFQICKSFRNGEETSARHNPEFTILEWYRTQADYVDLMQDCGDLFRRIARELDPVAEHPRLSYQGQTIDLAAPWERLSVEGAFRFYAGVEVLGDPAGLLKAARAKGYAVDRETTWEQAYHQIFLNEIEPHLGTDVPTILFDYPISMAALAKPSPRDPRVAERFELYVAGLELANAFSELTDPQEQLNRLEAEQAERRASGKTPYGIDDDFIRALACGLPPSAGIALGVDRLAMLFADVSSIRDVLWFPADELF